MTNVIHIDEESLLPGATEARNITGSLPLGEGNQFYRFTPIDSQPGLKSLKLTSHFQELQYQLSANGHQLHATAGTNGKTVFTLEIDKSGNYNFILEDNIDRSQLKNLINNSNLQENNKNIPLGWELDQLSDNRTTLHQQIDTIPGSPYQLSFYTQGNSHIAEGFEKVSLYWDNQLLYNIDTHQNGGKSLCCLVEGNSDNPFTTLTLVGEGSRDFFNHYLQDVNLVSTTQQQLPLDIQFQVLDKDHHVVNDNMTINITTTPPIDINNTNPHDVIYEQGVYQTIVVHTPGEYPLTTINLESLFKNLSIPVENRLVEIVQREENGHLTNVYEVKISDHHSEYPPITVADVQLYFPGGEGGLSVFQKHVLIDEGGGHTPPLVDII